MWRLTSASFAILQELLPAGFFAYEPADDGWFEDPAFYRNGEFMLGAVSHESEGILRVTETERRLLEAEVFKFQPHGSYVGY